MSYIGKRTMSVIKGNEFDEKEVMTMVNEFIMKYELDISRDIHEWRAGCNRIKRTGNNIKACHTCNKSIIDVSDIILIFGTSNHFWTQSIIQQASVNNIPVYIFKKK